MPFYAHAADIRIVEEDFSRDQGGFGGTRATEACERQRGAKRSCAAQEIVAIDRNDGHAKLHRAAFPNQPHHESSPTTGPAIAGPVGGDDAENVAAPSGATRI
jgi:hypothetical protein